MAALWLTFRLATVTTVLLMLIGIPLSWWLACQRGVSARIIRSIVAMPLVLPPTVLGFYLLIAMGPDGPIGKLSQFTGIGLLPFTFPGLVFASVLYSLPFVVQPLQAGFESIDPALLEVAFSLRARPWDTLLTVVLPLSKSAVFTAVVLGFTHTVGEFGVVLMIGGNIPNQTRVASVQIYDYVESMQYAEAHQLAVSLVLFSFVSLFSLYTLQPKSRLFLTR